MRWRLIKTLVTQQRLFDVDTSSIGRIQKRRGTVWQDRYWEHRIRDEDDYARHIDYIHVNPVKHGLVARARDWPYSSFHRFVAMEVLPLDWAGVVGDGEYGE